MSTTGNTSRQGANIELMRRHEILGVLCAAATLLLAFSIWSYDLGGKENWIGVVGNSIAGMLVSAFGLASYVIPIEFLLGTIFLFRRQTTGVWIVRISSTLATLLCGCALLHLSLGDLTVFGGHLTGGAIGELLAEVMRSLVGSIGSFVICITLLLITLLLRTPVSLTDTVQRLLFTATTGVKSFGRSVNSLWTAWREAKAIDEKERERTEKAAAPKILSELSTFAKSDKGIDPVEPKNEKRAPSSEGDNSKNNNEEISEDEDLQNCAREAFPPPKRTREPIIVAPRKDQLIAREEKGVFSTPLGRDSYTGRSYVLPPSTLLPDNGESNIPIDEETLKRNASQLAEKLAAYGVKGRVDEIHPGPVVTMYEFEPASGTKVSKIASLSDDLAMALAAQKVRIVAPIPGKARVGFELPNDVRQTVYLRELLEDERWKKLDCALPVIFGKDIAGRAVHGDLSKMPHLLVAGATGSGKSVGLSVILVSLLSKKAPDELRLLMIDPKVVELAAFDGIPHMLLPVVTDMKKAALALRWAVDEMERRYQLFADAGARNITSYNQRVDKVLCGEMPAVSLSPKRKAMVQAKGPDGDEVLLNPCDGERPDAEDVKVERLPHIVLVVDEFADLMMVAAKDVESAIARLAQKARAAGIHVVLATQRPSVDVITGMIKANFPCRVAYKVSQREDSKTILGRIGAEHLLGNGDMLMLLPGASDPKRVHSAYIHETEVAAVCDFLRAQGSPVYDEDIIKPRDDETDDLFSSGNTSEDSLYDRAVMIVADAGYCSISHIQRRLSIGYNKAAKIVERMEQEGVVGAPSAKAGGRREVLIQSL
ncbi:MAG: DNA translocase FtsK 4TM domain-containing protein [Deltaproteobacteria bacterium]|nr:DNA translocase FtsK 4TM domain-containing protein [Deltaproteobacteria bacterium]